MDHRILFVDDDPNILEAYRRQLRKQFTLVTAQGGEEGLRIIEANPPFAVIIADMRMPKMDGVEFLSRAKNLSPDSVRVMLTGNADQQTAIDAVNEGHIFRFLTKPCPPEKVVNTLRACLNQYALITSEKEMLEKTLTGCLRLVTDLIALSDPRMYGQAMKLRGYVRQVAAAMNRDCGWELELASMLAQIGQVALPVSLHAKLRSGAPLSEEEEMQVARIPKVGADLLSRIPRMGEVAMIVLHQNDRYAGGGGPWSRTGDAIPYGARLIRALRDLIELEAEGLPRHAALLVLKERDGWYDPEILRAIQSHLEVSPANGAGAAVGPQIPLFLRDLRPGDVLVNDVTALDGAVLLSAGETITSDSVVRLHDERETRGVREPILVLPAA